MVGTPITGITFAETLTGLTSLRLLYGMAVLQRRERVRLDRQDYRISPGRPNRDDAVESCATGDLDVSLGATGTVPWMVPLTAGANATPPEPGVIVPPIASTRVLRWNALQRGAAVDRQHRGLRDGQSRCRSLAFRSRTYSSANENHQ